MSVARLDPALVAMPRAATPTMPLALLAALAWVALTLAARLVSTGAFVGLAGLGFAVVVIRPFALRRRRGIDSGEVLLMFTLYYAFSLLLRGVGLLTFVDSPYLRELGDSGSERYRALVGWMFFHSALGLMAVHGAYDSRLARRWADALGARATALSAPWRARRLPGAVLGLLAIGVMGAISLVHGLGGLLTTAATPMSSNTDEALGHWWQIAITEFAVVGFHVCMLSMILRRDPRFLRTYLLLGLALCVPLYVITSSKFLLLRVLFLPWLFRHFVVRPIAMWKILVAFAGFGALFPFFYAYRALGLLNLDAIGLYLQTTETPILKLFNRSYGGDSFVLILHRTLDTLTLQWGHSLADLATFWIPRALWPAKPPSFGLEFPALYMPDMHWGAMTYVTPSLPGELFLDFHLPGVLAGCTLLGAGMRIAYAFARRGPGGLLLYGYAFLTALHLVEGCIASQLETMLTHLVPAVLALAWLTAGSRSASPRAEAAS